MLSRALTKATVTLLIGGFAAMPVRAENLEAGKSPSQIFAGTCSACHKGTRGLIKSVTPGSLPGFLRQHYTTSSEMAGQLSAYLLSNGAVDTRLGGGMTKQGKDARIDSRPEPKPEPKPVLAPALPEPRLGHRRRGVPPQEAEKPDLDGAAAQGERRREPRIEPAGRPPRNARRLARPGAEAAEPDRSAAEGTPGAAASQMGPDGRRLSAKHKLGKRGRPRGDDAANDDAAKTEPPRIETPRADAPKSDAAKTGTDKTGGTDRTGMEEDRGGEAAKAETSKEGGAKANTARAGGATGEGGKPEATRGEARGSETTLRADPVPQVAPAPKASEGETWPAQTAAPSAGPAASMSSGSRHTSEPAAVAGPATHSLDAPPAPPPAEPPTPPISR